MKKVIFLITLFVVGFCSSALAQTNQITLTTFYPAPWGMYKEMRVMGRLGVGMTNPVAKVDVYEDTALGLGVGNSQLIQQEGSRTGSNNIVYNTHWAYRDAGGTSWKTYRLHDAASVDATMRTPHASGVYTGTRAWWERDACADDLNCADAIQSWGDQNLTFMTLNGEKLGIGTTTPNEQLEITKNFRLPVTTATTGIINMGADRFIHAYGTNPNGVNSNNLFVGINAGNFTMTSPAQNNVGIGSSALGAITQGASNTAVGLSALHDNTTGNFNTAVGASALYKNLGNNLGDYNTAVGASALHDNTTGGSNTAVGWNALQKNSNGGNNTAVGLSALEKNTGAGSANTAVGAGALSGNLGTNNNTVVGANALTGNISGGDNTVVGANALTGTGAHNTVVGCWAGSNSLSGDYNIMIGAGANAPTATSSNTLNIGNLIYATGLSGNGKVGIGTTAPKTRLHVSGQIFQDVVGGQMIFRSPDTSCSACGPDNNDHWTCTSIACP